MAEITLIKGCLDFFYFWEVDVLDDYQLAGLLFLVLVAVLQCFGNVNLGYISLTCQVRDGASQLQHPVVTPPCQLHALHSHLHQLCGSFIQLAENPNLRWAHVSIGKEVGALEALVLQFPGRDDAFTNFLGGFTHPLVA